MKNITAFALCLFALVFCGIAAAQENKTALNNEIVLKMVNGGVSTEVIVNAIQTSPAKFSLEPDDLIDLSAKVPGPVIKAMQEKMNPAPTADRAILAPSTGNSLLDAYAKEAATEIFVESISGKKLPMEMPGDSKGHGVVLGAMKVASFMGKSTATNIFEGEQSSVQLSGTVTFLLKVPASSIDYYRLVSLKSNKGRREIVTSTNGTFKGVKDNLGKKLPSVERVDTNTHRVTYNNLGAGEYAFTLLTHINSVAGKFYTFGITDATQVAAK